MVGCHNFQVAGLDLPRWIPEAEQMHGCFWGPSDQAGLGLVCCIILSAALPCTDWLPIKCH